MSGTLFRAILVIGLCAAGPGWAKLVAAQYAGSAACAECHPSIYGRQVQSHHAQALRPMHGSLLESKLLHEAASPDKELTYRSSAKGVLVQERGTPEWSELFWAFGAGVQGMTPVGLLHGQFVEHQYSLYTRGDVFAPTFGHPLKPNAPIAKLGVMQDGRTVEHCFGCHSTGGATEAELVRNGPGEPGVRCERCHGPGSEHIARARENASAESVRREVVNPGRLPPRAQVEVCGQCHRLPSPDAGDMPELEDPVNVRFAPVGLMASRCFRESGSLSCLTCHDPHGKPEPRTAATYSAQCLRCHENDRTPIKLCKRKTRQNCLPCHMGQSALSPYLRFTNHRIRIGD